MIHIKYIKIILLREDNSVEYSDFLVGMFFYNFEDPRISWDYCACDVCNIDCLLMDIKDDFKDFNFPSGHNVNWIFDADNDCNSYYANDFINNSDNDYYCYYLKRDY